MTLPTTASAQAVFKASEIFGLSNMDYTSVASFLLSLYGHDAFRMGQDPRQLTKGTYLKIFIPFIGW